MQDECNMSAGSRAREKEEYTYNIHVLCDEIYQIFCGLYFFFCKLNNMYVSVKMRQHRIHICIFEIIVFDILSREMKL